MQQAMRAPHPLDDALTAAASGVWDMQTQRVRGFEPASLWSWCRRIGNNCLAATAIGAEIGRDILLCIGFFRLLESCFSRRGTWKIPEMAFPPDFFSCRGIVSGRLQRPFKAPSHSPRAWQSQMQPSPLMSHCWAIAYEPLLAPRPPKCTTLVFTKTM